MDIEVATAFGEVYNQMNELGRRIDNLATKRDNERKAEIEAITPYTETKTAYIGDTEVTFYTDVTGNLTVYFPYEYTVERLTDRIIITFEPLEEVTDITISIL